jgi:hypothetical protein
MVISNGTWTSLVLFKGAGFTAATQTRPFSGAYVPLNGRKETR